MAQHAKSLFFHYHRWAKINFPFRFRIRITRQGHSTQTMKPNQPRQAHHGTAKGRQAQKFIFSSRPQFLIRLPPGGRQCGGRPLRSPRGTAKEGQARKWTFSETQSFCIGGRSLSEHDQEVYFLFWPGANVNYFFRKGLILSKVYFFRFCA